MTDKEIQKAIEIIFYNASKDVTARQFYTIMTGEKGNYLKFCNESVNMLLALYHKILNKKKQDAFANKLRHSTSSFVVSWLEGRSQAYTYITNHQDIVFMFLLKIGKVEDALQMLEDYIIKIGRSCLFAVLKEALTKEPELFSDLHLDKILVIVTKYEGLLTQLDRYYTNTHYIMGSKKVAAYDENRVKEYKKSNKHEVFPCKILVGAIKDEVYKVQHKKLTSSLFDSINLETNQDKERLRRIITDFGFSVVLNETILKIDEKLYSAKDNFDFKNCIDLIRIFLHSLCLDVGSRIKKDKAIEPSEPLTEMGKAMSYFQDSRVRFLSDKEFDLLRSFNAYLSKEGVHRLQSDREAARISRNMAIGIGLFLVRRLEQFLSA